MERFKASWVGLCRIFKLANKVGYKDCEIQSTLCFWFYQCTDKEKQKLSELFPHLINDVINDMKDSEFYTNKVVLDWIKD